MRSQNYSTKQSAEVLQKLFITQQEFYVLIGRKSEANRMLYLTIKDKIEKDLKGKSKRLPDSIHIPIGPALDYLKDYGITRELILANARF